MTEGDFRKHLAFELMNKTYGIDIQWITAINEYDFSITRVPKVPKYIKGVINLRGDIIPIMDLSMKLGLDGVTPTSDTKIIIVNVNQTQIGLLVDEVYEIVNIDYELMETSISNVFSNPFILGLGKVSNEVITIIDVEKLLEQE